MCLVAVYIEQPDRSGERMLALSDVALVECADNGVRVTDLFGRSETFAARVRTVDLVKNEVVLEQRE
jgi:predicted RNA-binding protein